VNEVLLRGGYALSAGASVLGSVLAAAEVPLGPAARGFCWALAGVFAIAVAHKLSILARDRGRHPLLEPFPRLARHPAAALAVACASEASVVAALVASPLAGIALAGALLGGYTLVLRRVPPQAPCGCFGGGSEPAGYAMRRNLVLLVLCGAAALVLAVTGHAAHDAEASALAMLVFAVAFAAHVASRRTVSQLSTRYQDT
jgi:hypothetical protein